MDRYYEEDDKLQRTSRNSTLYEDIYSEKSNPNDNVTVIDNISEIDINKIKGVINNRESYKKIKKYENVMGVNEGDSTNKESYEYERVDESKYDINKIIESKKLENSDDEDKIRKISDVQYEVLSDSNSLNDSNSLVSDQEKNIRELMNTVTDSTDLFANLKESETTGVVSECSFYTNTVSFDKEDFDEKESEDVGDDEKGSSVFLKIIIVLSFLVAIGVFVWFKFFA